MPTRTLIASYLLMIVVAGVIYSHVEQKSAADSVWWAVVTASTVGYGDISPTAWQGRALAAQHEEQEELKADVRRMRALLEELAARQGVTVPGSGAPPVEGSARPGTRRPRR